MHAANSKRVPAAGVARTSRFLSRPLIRNGRRRTWTGTGETSLRAPPSMSDDDDADYRAHPERYRVGRGEQGVWSTEPYSSELKPLWRFRTPEQARASARRIWERFEQYREADDFVGMDVARKFLQMGYTRARARGSFVHRVEGAASRGAGGRAAILTTRRGSVAASKSPGATRPPPDRSDGGRCRRGDCRKRVTRRTRAAARRKRRRRSRSPTRSRSTLSCCPRTRRQWSRCPSARRTRSRGRR
jgi:hypothetical protein